MDMTMDEPIDMTILNSSQNSEHHTKTPSMLAGIPSATSATPSTSSSSDLRSFRLHVDLQKSANKNSMDTSEQSSKTQSKPEHCSRISVICANLNKPQSPLDQSSSQSGRESVTSESSSQSETQPAIAYNNTIECPICSAVAVDHLHYGGLACFSCKAFFRRMVVTQSKKSRRLFTSITCTQTFIPSFSGVGLVMVNASSHSANEITVPHVAFRDVCRAV